MRGFRLSPTPWVALVYSSQAFSVPNPKWRPGFQRVLTNTPALQAATSTMTELVPGPVILQYSSHSAHNSDQSRVLVPLAQQSVPVRGYMLASSNLQTQAFLSGHMKLNCQLAAPRIWRKKNRDPARLYPNAILRVTLGKWPLATLQRSAWDSVCLWEFEGLRYLEERSGVATENPQMLVWKKSPRKFR